MFTMFTKKHLSFLSLFIPTQIISSRWIKGCRVSISTVRWCHMQWPRQLGLRLTDHDFKAFRHCWAMRLPQVVQRAEALALTQRGIVVQCAPEVCFCEPSARHQSMMILMLYILFRVECCYFIHSSSLSVSFHMPRRDILWVQRTIWNLIECV